MTKQFLIFFFCTFIIASCKCGNKVNESGTTTITTASSANSTIDTNANLKGMTKEAGNTTTVNTTANDSGEDMMNKMYGNSNDAKQEMGKRKEMHRSGKLTAGFYPEGSERNLTNQDIQYLTPWGHAVMLNEIYARHGMIFKDEELKRHFTAQSWYHPASANVYQKLSSVEKQNISFLINTTKKEGNPDGVAAQQ